MTGKSRCNFWLDVMILALHWKWLAVMAWRYRQWGYSCAPGR